VVRWPCRWALATPAPGQAQLGIVVSIALSFKFRFLALRSSPYNERIVYICRAKLRKPRVKCRAVWCFMTIAVNEKKAVLFDCPWTASAFRLIDLLLGTFTRREYIWFAVTHH
jgi:hypothetical protein